MRASEGDRVCRPTIIIAPDRIDAVAHLFRAQRAVFIVPAVRRAIGRSDIELHQMDVLPDDVGRRAHLKVVQLVIAGHQIGVPELDDVVAVGPEEEGFGQARAVQGVRHITP